MRYAIICFFALFFVWQGIYAQNPARNLLGVAKETKMEAKTGKKDVKVFNSLDFATARAFINLPAVHKDLLFNQTAPLQKLQFFPALKPQFPSNYYLHNLGWVCVREWEFEKRTAIPLRIRLGSKEQVDWLEGKRR